MVLLLASLIVVSPMELDNAVSRVEKAAVRAEMAAGRAVQSAELAFRSAEKSRENRVQDAGFKSPQGSKGLFEPLFRLVTELQTVIACTGAKAAMW